MSKAFVRPKKSAVTKFHCLSLCIYRYLDVLEDPGLTGTVLVSGKAAMAFKLPHQLRIYHSFKEFA